MLSGRGLCDELITRPEESCRLWCVVVCDLENLKNEEAMTSVGSQSHSKKKKKTLPLTVIFPHVTLEPPTIAGVAICHKKFRDPLCIWWCQRDFANVCF